MMNTDEREAMERRALIFFVSQTVKDEGGRLLFVDRTYPQVATDFALSETEVLRERLAQAEAIILQVNLDIDHTEQSAKLADLYSERYDLYAGLK
jgi:hypothetical protein